MFRTEKTQYPLTKVDIFSRKKEEEKFHVMQKDSFFDRWREVGQFMTYDDAYEFALSRGEKVTYLGIFENGSRKGMMDFSPYTPKIDPKEFKRRSFEAYKDYDPEKSRGNPGVMGHKDETVDPNKPKIKRITQ